VTRRRLIAMAGVAGLVALIAACGKKGALDRPSPETQETDPKETEKKKG
jgi:predicted small lipoprotein YifL